MISGKYFDLEKDNRFNLIINPSGWQPLTNSKRSDESSINTLTIYVLSGYNNLYIGSDSRNGRPGVHFNDLSKNKHENQYMQNVVNKHGISGFYYQVLTKIPVEYAEFRDQIENSYIKLFDTYHNGYNLVEFADTPMLGRIMSKESREKMSESGKIKIFTEEHKNNISQSVSGDKNGFYGKKHTSSTKEKISSFHKGKAWVKGIPKTQEHKDNLSRSNPTKRKVTIININTNEKMEIDGVKKFCIENNLDRRDFYKMISGKKEIYRGWKLYNDTRN